MNCVTCLGTGDGWPSATRNHSAYLYRLGTTTLLIDCGDPVGRSYKATGLRYDLIDTLFLSHLHADHVGGFFMLMQGMWLERRRKALPVFLPDGAIQPVRQMLHTGFLFDEVLPFRLKLNPLEAGQPIAVKKAQVTPYPTSHLEGLKRRFAGKYAADFRAYSFLIETPGLRIAHSADLGCAEDLTPLVTKPLDLLVCELAHFSPKSVFSFLQGREILQMVWIHLGRPQRKNLQQIRALAERMLPGVKHTFAEDGQEIHLD